MKDVVGKTRILGCLDNGVLTLVHVVVKREKSPMFTCVNDDTPTE